MKNFSINKIFIFLIFSICIFACRNKIVYEKTLEKYLFYLQKNNLHKAYGLLSNEDREIVSLNEFIKKDELTPISRIINKSLKYKIIDSMLSETGRVARVNVEVSKLDLYQLYVIAPELLNKNLNEEEINKILFSKKNYLKNSYDKFIKQYKLVYEDDMWRILADYKRQQRKQEYLDKAKKYYINHDYKKSLENYNTVLDFDTQNTDALNGFLKVKEKINYIEKDIEIDCIKIQKDSQDSILTIAVKNNGTYIIKKLIIDIKTNKGADILKNYVFYNEKDDKKLGYNTKIIKKIKISSAYTDNDVKCLISGIEF